MPIPTKHSRIHVDDKRWEFSLFSCRLPQFVQRGLERLGEEGKTMPIPRAQYTAVLAISAGSDPKAAGTLRTWLVWRAAGWATLSWLAADSFARWVQATKNQSGPSHLGCVAQHPMPEME